MAGRVVRAVGGRRSEYRPVRSVLTDSTEPALVASVLATVTGAKRIYIADLDGIVNHTPDPASVRAIRAAGVPVLCDGGVRSARDAQLWAEEADFVVVGTETAGPAVLDALPPERTVLSVDLFDGRIIGDWCTWGASGPDAVVELAGLAVRRGVGTLLLLDLARVGTGTGTGTERLVAACKREYRGVNVLAGGGVRSWADIDRLTDAGADGILVASALHDGAITLPRPAL